MCFVAYYFIHVILLALGLVFAWRIVSKLRNTSALYNPHLLPFAYFSLSSWILVAFQYVLLAASPRISFPSDFFRATGLWLSTTQSALWACAVLSLKSKQVPRILDNLAFVKVLALVIAFALLTYRTEVLTSQVFVQIESVMGFVMFTLLALSMQEWRLSRLCIAAFLVHGYSQWIWGFVWFIPAPETHFAFLAFPAWRLALFAAWIAVLSAMLKLRITIGSTGDDLANDRKAVHNALNELHFEKVEALIFDSLLPQLPGRTLFLKQSDILILIIRDQYGALIEPEGISVTEFEYNVAHEQNPQKILVYVKDGVTHAPRLEEFLKRIKNSEPVYVISPFTTAEDLAGKIQHDLSHWLTSNVKQNTGTVSLYAGVRNDAG